MTSYLQSGEATQRKKITLNSLAAMRRNDEKIAMLTCYDASFATLMDRCGIDIMLVGDSLGMVCQGHDSTLPVTLDEIAYHTACVARAQTMALLVSDMPFATYALPEQAFEHAARLMRCGAQMVKLEGGAWLLPTVRFLVERGIPVCAHLGLTPQSVHQLSGYKVQAKTTDAAAQLQADALALESAGASLLVLEAIPASLAAQVTTALTIPTIGIGAGIGCSGQVLVMHDLLGVFPGHQARFVKNFMQGQNSIAEAFSAYVQAVKTKSFPAAEHSF